MENRGGEPSGLLLKAYSSVGFLPRAVYQRFFPSPNRQLDSPGVIFCHGRRHFEQSMIIFQ